MSAPAAEPEALPPALAAVRDFRSGLAGSGADLGDEQRIDYLRELEDAKAAIAAEQARVTVAFEDSQRQKAADRGVRSARRSRGVAAQVALARRESPNRGGRRLGAARAWVEEMPFTLEALESGHLSEWRAELLVRETAVLTREQREVVDREVCGDPERLVGVGDQRLVAMARRVAHRLDPMAAVRRASRAERDRNVTCRPAPDTMARLSALLPVARGVAVYAALKKYADQRVAAGDPRSRGQLMADRLFELVTGAEVADGLPVALQLVMTDAAFAGESDEPADVVGHGPVPARWARDLLRTAVEQSGAQAAGWLRRVFTDPVTGDITAMDSRAREFCEGLETLIGVRDAGTCRTPYCDAPIRHHDHAKDYASGGRTNAANGQGLCEACNHAKQADGWSARPRPGPRHTVETTTPTGHTYTSTAPAPPGTRPSTYPLTIDIIWPLGAPHAA